MKKTSIKLSLLLLCLSAGQNLLQGYAYAADSLTETSESPQAEATAVPIATAPVSASAPITLTGGVHKRDTYSTALKKLAAGVELNSDEYRSLNVGVIGYDTDRTFFTKMATVTSLYDGCPAKEAGIELGDKEVEVNAKEEDAAVVDPTVPTWSFGCGYAGDPVDLTMKRHGKILQFHLIRMNMEDVPDLKLRHTYEELVKVTGVNKGYVAVPKAVLDKIQAGD